MGKFIVSRTQSGVSFDLLDDKGRRLATSRTYATLDACKKGIASLIVNAPVVPLLDSSAGEYGPNPKFEVVASDEGYGFMLKSANGKSVITSPTYATKKACLRAASMLRKGVVDAKVLFLQKQGPVSLTMTAHMAAVGAVTVEKKAPAASDAPLLEEPIASPASEPYDASLPAVEEVVAEAASEPFAITPPPAAPAPAASKQHRVPPAVPRVIRLQPSGGVRQGNSKKTASPVKKASVSLKRSSRALLDFLLKRK
ncbi:MAG: DUF1508 domain-containing protein [Ruminococcaceae bacterium]|nr:DUF1508 domain-containing protein [Oscillospiraceae bacterium]